MERESALFPCRRCGWSLAPPPQGCLGVKAVQELSEDHSPIPHHSHHSLPLSSLSFIVLSSYVSLSTLCFYLADKNVEAKYSVRNSARPS